MSFVWFMSNLRLQLRLELGHIMVGEGETKAVIIMCSILEEL